ncbi:MAG: hypothetical protein ABIJ34_05635 [archaeon]
MRPYCPRCSSFDIVALESGYYRCNSCGYLGSLGIEKGIRKS